MYPLVSSMHGLCERILLSDIPVTYADNAAQVRISIVGGYAG